MNNIGSTDVIQVCVIVRDIEKTLDNYAKLFGIEKPQIRKVPPYTDTHAEYRGVPCNSAARICSFKMGAISLELIEPDDEPSVWKEFLDKKGEGVCYLGLFVPDSADTVKFLEGEGAKVVHRGETATGNYNSVDTSEELGVMLNIKQKY